MKRCWLGAGMLLLLLVLGLVCGSFLGRFGTELGREAERAALLVAENREEAEKILQEIRRCWEEKRPWLTVLTDQQPLLDIETLLRLLEDSPETVPFRENALRLSRKSGQVHRTHLVACSACCSQPPAPVARADQAGPGERPVV